MKNIILSIFSILIFISCDEIPVTVGDIVLPDNDRVVLLEELTGASCPNCPKGSAAVEAIQGVYGNKVAAIAIHGDFLAQPITDRSKYDFRNPKARDLENWLKPFLGKPCATVNRVDLGDPDEKYATSVTGLWQSLVETELSKPNTVSLFMDVDYNSDIRVVDVSITAIPLVDLNGEYNLSIFITESNILDAQTNGSIIIDDFVHNHVLRDMITRFDGDAFTSNPLKGIAIKRQFSYTLPSEPEGLWIPKNIDIVAAFHKAGANDREIMQVAHSPLTE